MKKNFFVITVLIFFSIFKTASADTNCVKWIDGLNRTQINCYKNETELKDHLERIVSFRNTYPNDRSIYQIKGIIKENAEGDLLYYGYTENVRTVERDKEEFIPQNAFKVGVSGSILGAIDNSPGKQNLFCANKAGEASVCYDTAIKCKTALDEIKPRTSAIGDCDGDGDLRTISGVKVNSDGNRVDDFTVIPGVSGDSTPNPGIQYCFKNLEGKDECGKDLAACNRARSSYDVYNPDTLVWDSPENLGACTEKAAPSGSTTEDSNVDPGSKGNSNATDPGSAGNTTNKAAVKLQNPLGDITNLNQLITRVVNIALRLALIIASLAILWAGFQFVMAQGKEDKVKEAKKRLQWTVIGLAVILGANVIVRIVDATIRSLGTGIK